MLKRIFNFIADFLSHESRIKRELEKNEAIHRSNGYEHSSTISIGGNREKKGQILVSKAPVTTFSGASHANGQTTTIYTTAMAAGSINEPSNSCVNTSISTYSDTSSDSGSSGGCD